jgi:hypothetical protein
MRLFHISEEAGIEAFQPRPASEAWPELEGRYVWAIEEELLTNYLFPRDCPRVCLRATDASDPAHVDSLMAGDRSPLILLDERWRQSVNRAKLFLHEFCPNDFKLLHKCAGYWVSEETQYPIRTETVDDALAQIREAGVRVQFRTDLETIVREVAKSSLRFSIIKMNNAPGNCR